MKLFLKYLKQHIPVITAGILFFIIFIISFYLYHLPLEAVIYPLALCMIIGLIIVLYDFSKFLRASLDALQQEDLIPFSTELEQIKAYLNIENKRFSNRICAEYDIETEDFKIPALTIEPLVVNAVRHGLRKGKDTGTVVLRTQKNLDSVIIEVEDNGTGFDAGAWEMTDTDQSYMGISNVRSRLIRQVKADFHIKSVLGQGTIIHIEIPLQKGRILDENHSGR